MTGDKAMRSSTTLLALMITVVGAELTGSRPPRAESINFYKKETDKF